MKNLDSVKKKLENINVRLWVTVILAVWHIALVVIFVFTEIGRDILLLVTCAGFILLAAYGLMKLRKICLDWFIKNGFNVSEHIEFKKKTKKSKTVHEEVFDSTDSEGAVTIKKVDDNVETVSEESLETISANVEEFTSTDGEGTNDSDTPVYEVPTIELASE